MLADRAAVVVVAARGRRLELARRAAAVAIDRVAIVTRLAGVQLAVAAADVTLVGLAVAVVVEPVADLRRTTRSGADQQPGLALEGSAGAPPRATGRACPAAAGIALVGLAVAVVVDGVARLRRRRCIAHAIQRPALALIGARGTGPELSSAACRTAGTLVGLPVAVVVAAVADFRCRGPRSCTARGTATPQRADARPSPGAGAAADAA